MLTLVPAFGRDYSSKKALLEDWKQNKDFLVSDISCKWDGKPANKADIESCGEYSQVKIRFKKLADFVIIKV